MQPLKKNHPSTNVLFLISESYLTFGEHGAREETMCLLRVLIVTVANLNQINVLSKDVLG